MDLHRLTAGGGRPPDRSGRGSARSSWSTLAWPASARWSRKSRHGRFWIPNTPSPRRAPLKLAALWDGRLAPYHGVPVGIKDIFDTADMPTEHGSPLLCPGHTPSRDAAVVARLKAAGGALILGKTVTAEFASRTPGKTQEPAQPGAHAWWVVQRLGGSRGGAHGAARPRQPDGRLDDDGPRHRSVASYGFKPTHGLITVTACSGSRALWTTWVCSRERSKTSPCSPSS